MLIRKSTNAYIQNIINVLESDDVSETFKLPLSEDERYTLIDYLQKGSLWQMMTETHFTPAALLKAQEIHATYFPQYILRTSEDSGDVWTPVRVQENGIPVAVSVAGIDLFKIDPTTIIAAA